MTIHAGTRLGPYEIQSALGAGGMGEVYRARDTRLDRIVAIKVLPEHLVGDAQFRERFDREARVISSLDHPHICTLYDIGQQDAIAYLVMQYLEGETLADRVVSTGPSGVPIDDALQIAIQVASALDAAHRAGIVHRDLKPGNIMLTKAARGRHGSPHAVLLDFGLAKVTAPVVAVTASMAPTTPPNMTGQGTLLGTFQYMAPEQIEGLEADARTDIFAFGTVFFEVLAGRPAFEGKTRASLLGAILKDEPPQISTVRVDAPHALDRIVATCLAKEPDDRWQTARDLLRELNWVADGTIAETRTPDAGRAASTDVRPRQRDRVLPWAIAGVLGVALAATLALWAPWRVEPSASPIRFAIAPGLLNRNDTDRHLAIAPDGTRMAYIGLVSGIPQLMIRAFDSIDAEPLEGTAGARMPFFSQDGRWIGFFQGNELKKVWFSGGPSVTICQVPAAPRGASWGPNDTIVFATTDAQTGLFSVAASGGEPRALGMLGASTVERRYSPHVIRDGRAVLFTLIPRGGGEQVAVLDLESGQQKTLIPGASDAKYVETGHLVFATAGTLRAIRFDPQRLDVVGDPLPVVDEVAMATLTGTAQYDVSRTGTLVHLPTWPGGAAATRSLVWVDRQGHEEFAKAPPRAYFALRLSPDGTRAAIDIRDQENDIWIWELRRQTLTRLTFDRFNDVFPVWTPDGARVAYTRAGQLFWRRADGAGTEEQLSSAGINHFAMSFSPDGSSLVVTEQKGSNDLALIRMDGKNAVLPLIQTMFTEGLAEISPDGRWLAYQSNETGQDEVYVRAFPDVNSGRWQVSPNGGGKPVWARSGRELFYLDAAGAVTAVPVQSAAAFSSGNATKLFDTRYFSAVQARSYDVSPDGQRFLMIKDTPAPEQATDSAPASIIVVLNWFEELKARLP